jgi:hypothetical protein
LDIHLVDQLELQLVKVALVKALMSSELSWWARVMLHLAQVTWNLLRLVQVIWAQMAMM